MGRMVGELESGRGWDLEAFEMGMRQGVHELGAQLLEKVLNADGGGDGASRLVCQCGGQAELMGYRRKKVLTVVGEVSLRRGYYWCRSCGEGRIPKDRELDVSGGRLSPGVRRMAARVGAKEPFAEGARDLKELAGIEMGAKEVERVCKQVGGQVEQLRSEEEKAVWQGRYQAVAGTADRLYVEIDGTGIPVVREETRGRAGKGPDGSSKTREVKIGCIFSQVGLTSQGVPQREEGTTSYVAAIEGAQAFGRRLYGEAFKRGVERAKEVVVIGDGAAWIWNLAAEHFPSATQIVDLYHARQHLYALKEVVGQESVEQCLALLEQGCIGSLMQQLALLQSTDPEQREKFRQEIVYFQNNGHRMNYPQFRSRGLFVGSGVVEAGCRTVIASRLKQSGMFWSVQGANQVLQVRTTLKNGYWENFWESRAEN